MSWVKNPSSNPNYRAERPMRLGRNCPRLPKILVGLIGIMQKHLNKIIIVWVALLHYCIVCIRNGNGTTTLGFYFWFPSGKLRYFRKHIHKKRYRKSVSVKFLVCSKSISIICRTVYTVFNMDLRYPCESSRRFRK